MAEAGEVILTARNPDRLEHAAREVAALSTAAFGATDPNELARFFDGPQTPIDHLLLSGRGPYDAPLAEPTSPKCTMRGGTGRLGPGRDAVDRDVARSHPVGAGECGRRRSHPWGRS
jgi:hypothetical protein